MVSNPTSLAGLKRIDAKVINDLQVVSYARLEDGIYKNVVTTVRTGKTLKGSLLFESPNPDVSLTFAMLYPELMYRKFRDKNKKLFGAWFSKAYPNHMLGTEQYDRFRNQLVKFEENVESEKLGYIKIH